MGGKIVYIRDEEVEMLLSSLGTTRLVRLKSGVILNVASIACIDDVELEPHYWDNRIYENKLGRYFFRDGQKIFIESEKDVFYKIPESIKNRADFVKLNEESGAMRSIKKLN